MSMPPPRSVEKAAHSTAVTLAQDLDLALRALGTPARAAQEKRYLKSDLEHYGVPVPAMRKAVTTACAAQAPLTRSTLLDTVRALWEVPVHERRAAAVELLVRRVGALHSDDLGLIETLLRASRTWALVDVLSVHVAGPLVTRFGALGATLDRWATDPDFWVRRAAMLTLLVPLRKGGGDFDRFGRYADAMLDEKEFFIRKAIGWVLRETARKRPALVADWVLPRARRASGLTFREATRTLPDALRTPLEQARARRET